MFLRPALCSVPVAAARPRVLAPGSHSVQCAVPPPPLLPLRGLRRCPPARALASSSAAEVERQYPGAEIHFTRELAFAPAVPVIPTYQVMAKDGSILDGATDPGLGEEMLIRIYKTMIKVSAMDSMMNKVQRQGGISFYMMMAGEEALVGSAAALELSDPIWAQYREAITLMWRGFTIDEFLNQCYSNALDGGKGRQMPVHYGSARHNFQTISSPLTTQLPQAAGAGYALKMMGRKAVVMVYFGDGAASEGDAHAAMNFAAVLGSPTIFFCRNNGYAISTPTSDQYKGDGIGGRAAGYGMKVIRVDGNDVFAVYAATKFARAYALEHSAPVMIEAMSYRVGDHSTSDDSTRYRPAEEVAWWRQQNSPISRLGAYMRRRGIWDDAKDKVLNESITKKVLDALRHAEQLPKPPISELFTDVYAELPPHLEEQQRHLAAHLAQFPTNYALEHYATSSMLPEGSAGSRFPPDVD